MYVFVSIKQKSNKNFRILFAFFFLCLYIYIYICVCICWWNYFSHITYIFPIIFTWKPKRSINNAVYLFLCNTSIEFALVLVCTYVLKVVIDFCQTWKMTPLRASQIWYSPTCKFNRVSVLFLAAVAAAPAASPHTYTLPIQFIRALH